MRVQKLTVTAHPELDPDKPYRARVTDLKANKKANELRLELRFLDRSQEGRSHTLTLPLPVHPTGTTADFFRAVGMDVSLASEIRPADAIGRTLLVCFGAPSDGDSEVSACFKAIA